MISGFPPLQFNSQSPQIQNQVPISQNNSIPTGFSQSIPNGFQPQGQFPTFIPSSAPQKQEIPTLNANNIPPSVVPVTSVPNQQHNIVPEVSPNQDKSSLELAQLQNQLQGQLQRLTQSQPQGPPQNPSQGQPQMPFTSQDQVAPLNTVPVLNQQNQLNYNFPQQYQMKPPGMSTPSQQQITTPGFPQSQPQTPVVSQPVNLGNAASNFGPGNVNVNSFSNHQELPKSQNFVNQQTLPIKPPTSIPSQQQNGMGLGVPQGQPQNQLPTSQGLVSSQDQSVPSNTIPMMNTNFSQSFSTTTTLSQQQNGTGLRMVQGPSQGPLQGSPNVFQGQPYGVPQSLPQGVPQGPFVPGNQDQGRPAGSDGPNQSQKYSIAPSPYAGYASKKAPTATVPKDSPWHQNIQQFPKSSTTQQSGYVSPFAPQNRQQNPSPFQSIQPTPPQTATYFAGNNQVNQQAKKQDEKPKDPTQVCFCIE